MVCFWVVTFDAPAIVRHHSNVPSSLISSFYFLDVLVEAFTLFVANIATVSRKPVKIVMQEVHFDTNVSSQTLICIYDVLLRFLQSLGPSYYRRSSVQLQPNPAMHQLRVDSLKVWSSRLALFFGSRVHQRSLLLSFSILSPEDDRQMYLEHSPSLYVEGGVLSFSGYKEFIYYVFVSHSECYSRLPILFNPMVGFIETVPHT